MYSEGEFAKRVMPITPQRTTGIIGPPADCGQRSIPVIPLSCLLRGMTRGWRPDRSDGSTIASPCASRTFSSVGSSGGGSIAA
eukprot:498474-Pyramimonas_sp.AAC.1